MPWNSQKEEESRKLLFWTRDADLGISAPGTDFNCDMDGNGVAWWTAAPRLTVTPGVALPPHTLLEETPCSGLHRMADLCCR